MPLEDRSRRTPNRKVYWAALLYLLVIALMAALTYYDASQSKFTDLDPSLLPGLSADQPWQRVLSTLAIVLVSLIASLPVFMTVSQRLRDSNAALQLDLAEYYRDLDRLPSLDELTSQYNRDSFLRSLHRECVRCRRHGLDACIAMLEIDDFAELQTARGQAAADVEITISFGITSVQQTDADGETLVRIAQRRLDRAASAGRDLVVAADA
jgi:GGDEF domain-containing protein